ncbi:flavodoxin domain-containing protein [Nocardia tengchongensis]|uniref:flavodoxin domain-containing protein n=1 Tax=Nocardia tengchongensis TaxID=2055889 RepID=UPI003650D488
MTREPVLVAYGSKRGGTAEIAEWIGESLRAAHIPAEVRPAREVRSLDGFGAVVLGGALYTGRWHRDARRFARRFGRPLRERPVWVFASGPLDDSTDAGADGNAFGAKSIHKYAARLDARATALFGGRLESTARGFPASAMAKNSAGDFRNRDRIDAWAKDIVAQLG